MRSQDDNHIDARASGCAGRWVLAVADLLSCPVAVVAAFPDTPIRLIVPFRPVVRPT